MWAGIPPKHESSDHDAAAKLPAYFGCPQQPSLRLPLSRVNDGVCDCCDGADEDDQSSAISSSSTTTTTVTTFCLDSCDQALAEERAARAKAQSDFAFGSKRRLESISQYKKWHAEKSKELHQLKEVQLVGTMEELGGVEQALVEAKVSLAREWLRVVNQQVLGGGDVQAQPLMEIVGNSSMSLEDLASFIISLCWLSAEVSAGNVSNDRCVALDRASLDLGILWNYSSKDDDGDGDDISLPSFDYLDSGTDIALVDFAEKIMLRFEGKDTAKDKTASRSRKNTKRKSKQVEHIEPDYDSGDDPYGDDWEDQTLYNNDDDYVMGEDDDLNSHEGDDGEGDSPTGEGHNQLFLKSLLDKVPLDRSLFKEQSKLLLKIASEAPKDTDESIEGDADESLTEDESDNNEEDSMTSGNGGVDPMALQMAKATISKRLSNISRGETSAKSAARFIASLMETSDSVLGDMKNMAIMAMYHSKLAAEDVAELVYSTSSNLRSTTEEASGAESSIDNRESSCSSPWRSTMMCPTPRTVPLKNADDTMYPPSFIVEAAQKRCEQREKSTDVCAAVSQEGEEEMEFPTTVPDGYYSYYVPQSRSGSEEDGLTPYFSSIDSLHEKMPINLSELKKRKEDVDRKKNSLTKKVADLEDETGDGSNTGSSKFGVDGELYILGDTCHKLESGKYEYEVCIFGKASQRDIGQTSGGTNLGSWEAITEEDGPYQRMLKWGGGTKCWNGPARSAEVLVTCGADTKFLTADEPETCRYVFTMASPIGCDERFKVKNSL